MTDNLLNGRYGILSKIGNGGMQSVSKAHDVLTDRHVALKTPLPGQAHRRFAASAQIAARVNNHNVAKTYDYFVEQDIPYLIEELVDGPNLEESITDGQYVDPHAGARIFRILSLGVAASHAAGVIHRDLKPSNVIAVGGVKLDKLKITDFGIATLTDEVLEEAALSGDITRSNSGTVKGALPYMSPEMMFRKRGDRPGASSDVWSIGAMMFRLLTGEYPFGVGFEVPANIKTGDRTPWPAFMNSSVDFRDLASELQALVESCLVLNKDTRPTAEQLVEACSKLCYSDKDREIGIVTDVTGARRFARSDSGKKIFFHSKSVYGSSQPSIGDRIVFSSYPGSPFPRAHPVVNLGH